jgi:protein-L-isoaspartate(D-aspartate) O-methyltransferase
MADAMALRTQMVDRLEDAGVLVTPDVRDAIAAVPRHLFVPECTLHTAYADRAVLVKYADDGSPLSSISQPTMVTIMLELLGVRRRHHVLEIGTGSGYNAALLAAMAGREGHVVSVEIDPDLAHRAELVLASAGYLVDVVLGDGREGYGAGAPYDRMIVTAGAREVESAWSEQLAEGGRLIVPIVDERGLGSIIVTDKVAGELHRDRAARCGFLPLR